MKEMNWLILLISALATYRLSLMLSSEEGPLAIFARMRRKVPPKTNPGRGIRCYVLERLGRGSGDALFALVRHDHERNFAPTGTAAPKWVVAIRTLERLDQFKRAGDTSNWFSRDRHGSRINERPYRQISGFANCQLESVCTIRAARIGSVKLAVRCEYSELARWSIQSWLLTARAPCFPSCSVFLRTRMNCCSSFFKSASDSS